MPKPPMVRSELLEFMGEHAQPITTPIPDLFREWVKWRRERGLNTASEKERSFRQNVARLEHLGYLAIEREGRSIISLKLLEAPPPGAAERLRQLAREQAVARGRFATASPGLERDLRHLRTPHLNEYINTRRAIERARLDFRRNGLDPDDLLAGEALRRSLNPLGEEALALKERLMRVETELMAWRALGVTHNLAVELPEEIEVSRGKAVPA